MSDPATGSEWLGAAITIAVALGILSLIWYLFGDPDRSDRLRARFGPFESFFQIALAVLSAGRAIYALGSAQPKDALISAGVAIIWGWLAYRTWRDHHLTPPAP